MQSEAYGAAVSKTGVFGDADSLGFAISRPLHITDDTALITASTGVAEARDIIYSSGSLRLVSSTPETDLELGYSTALDDGMSLQASALYQDNVGGDAGESAIAAFVTLKGRW